MPESRFSDDELETQRQNCQALIESQQTALLATADAEGVPHNSYAPYVRDASGTFYVFVSELAQHTQNLLHNPHASVFFIRPESESGNLFARERVGFQCAVEPISNTDPRYAEQLSELQAKFGDIVPMLRGLPDFHLFALTPRQGTYVVGFGRAFSIQLPDGALQHISRSTNNPNPSP